MTRLSIEAKVGFFVVVGIVILAYMSMKVGKLPYGPDQGQVIYGYFESAQGLVKGVSVEIAGVDVGQVEDIALDQGRAKVTLRINPDIPVGEDTVAAIRTKGVLGDKYVELILGDEKSPPLKSGGSLTHTISPPNIDSLLQQIGAIGEDIKNLTQTFTVAITGDDGTGSLKVVLENLKELTVTLNETVKNNRDNIDRTLGNFSVFSQDLQKISSQNRQAFSEIVANFQKASEQLRDAVAAVSLIADKINRGEGTIGRLIHDDATVDSMNETLVALKDITEKINRGEGTIGKLVKDEETVENLNDTLSSINEFLQKEARFQTFVDYRGEYLFDVEEVKSYLSVKIQPQEDKYYLLGIVDDPAGKRKETITTRTIGGITTTEVKNEIEKDEIKFSAQIAKRYYDLGLRAGLFESTGGIATDYYAWDDRMVFSLEAFDFRSDESPHLKFRVDFTPWNYLYLTGGFDDFVSDFDRESFFLGIGLQFSDKDLKTLLYGAPIPN